MRLLPLSLAALLAATLMPAIAAPFPAPAQPQVENWVIKVGCRSNGGNNDASGSWSATPREDDCRQVQVDGNRNNGRRPVDCHRDVRTHRIGGVMLRHRHVGDDCQVREVRRATSLTPN